MASKTSPDGLHHQIDELDALLDRLLQLPLGPAPAPPTSSSTLKLAQPGDSLLEVMDESLELEVPVLRLPMREVVSDPAEEPPLSRPHLAPLTSEFGTFPNLDAEPGEAEPPILSLPAVEPPVNRLDPQHIPWLDDEPIAPPTAESPPKPNPLPPVTASSAPGPRIEIIQGSLTTSLLMLDGTLAETVIPDDAAPAGWLRRTCWFVTWLFDATVGALLPGLRRTAGRRFLALAGLALLGTSGYLAWKWWW